MKKPLTKREKTILSTVPMFFALHAIYLGLRDEKKFASSLERLIGTKDKHGNQIRMGMLEQIERSKAREKLRDILMEGVE